MQLLRCSVCPRCLSGTGQPCFKWQCLHPVDRKCHLSKYIEQGAVSAHTRGLELDPALQTCSTLMGGTYGIFTECEAVYYGESNDTHLRFYNHLFGGNPGNIVSNHIKTCCPVKGVVILAVSEFLDERRAVESRHIIASGLNCMNTKMKSAKQKRDIFLSPVPLSACTEKCDLCRIHIYDKKQQFRACKKFPLSPVR